MNAPKVHYKSNGSFLEFQEEALGIPAQALGPLLM
jgi:hypothetical protein